MLGSGLAQHQLEVICFLNKPFGYNNLISVSTCNSKNYQVIPVQIGSAGEFFGPLLNSFDCSDWNDRKAGMIGKLK